MFSALSTVQGSDISLFENGNIPVCLEPYFFPRVRRTGLQGKFGKILLQKQHWGACSLTYMTALIDESAHFEFPLPYPVLHSILGIQGSIQWHLKRFRLTTCGAGQYTIQYYPSGQGALYFPAPGTYEYVSITIDPAFLFRIRIPEDLLKPLDNAIERQIPYMMGPHKHLYVARPEMASIPRDIFTCLLPNGFRKAYTYAKVVEWMLFAIADLTAHPYLDEDVRDKVEQAANLVDRDPWGNSDIEQLAGKVEIPIKKLKAGFREVFGTTVGNYIAGKKSEQNDGRTTLKNNSRALSVEIPTVTSLLPEASLVPEIPAPVSPNTLSLH